MGRAEFSNFCPRRRATATACGGFAGVCCGGGGEIKRSRRPPGSLPGWREGLTPRVVQGVELCWYLSHPLACRQAVVMVTNVDSSGGLRRGRAILPRRACEGVHPSQ